MFILPKASITNFMEVTGKRALSIDKPFKISQSAT